jgi:hypothetical protein
MDTQLDERVHCTRTLHLPSLLVVFVQKEINEVGEEEVVGFFFSVTENVQKGR